MGFFGDLVDDVFSVPGKILEGTSRMVGDVVYNGIRLPAEVVSKAVDAGCKTAKEMHDWAERNDLI